MEKGALSQRTTLEKHDHIGVLTINNPPQNFIEKPEFFDLEALDQFIQSNSLKALILRGQGRHFSAGASVDNIQHESVNDSMENELQKGRKLLDYLSNLDIPVVALLTGVCFGAGLEIALSCHFRIAAENALLGFPEVDIGLMPGFSGTIRLSKLVGKGKSLEIVLSGEYINAEKALEYGLVDYVVKKDEILAFTLNHLKRLTDNRSLQAIRFITKSVRNSFTMEPQEAMKEEAKMFCILAKERFHQGLLK